MIKGDGTGVGKTMELTGIVLEAFLNEYIDRVLWIVPNQGLISSATSEIKKMSRFNFETLTYKPFLELKEKEFADSGIVFLTYQSLSMKKTQRRLETWLGESYNGMVRLKTRINLIFTR